MSLCPAFLVRGGAIYRCVFNPGHAVPHFGYGARSITYAKGPAPGQSWNDNEPGANGSFRQPDDHSGKTPYDGQQVIPGDSTVQ
ncbi:MAG: hypothetical protein M3O41_14320 [Pseudomonadota bacterium]|nr:hypothetical protein [Pseudomonadota bacterium]